jgi:GNAT superfamily N-acetyltransferase
MGLYRWIILALAALAIADGVALCSLRGVWRWELPRAWAILIARVVSLAGLAVVVAASVWAFEAPHIGFAITPYVGFAFGFAYVLFGFSEVSIVRPSRCALPDGGQFRIRTAVSADVDGLMRIFGQLTVLEVRSRFPAGAMPSRDTVQREVTSGNVLVAALPSEEPIGEAVYETAGANALAIMCSVAPTQRGRGVASALIDAVADRAPAMGADRLTASVLAGNSPAHELLNRRGWTFLRWEGDRAEYELTL